MIVATVTYPGGSVDYRGVETINTDYGVLNILLGGERFIFAPGEWQTVRVVDDDE
jgi:hypothetical protein